MNTLDFVSEAALSDLMKELPSLSKHNYNTIDTMVHRIAAKHRLTRKLLSDLFFKKYSKTPKEWVKGKLDEQGTNDTNLEQEVDKFVDWAIGILHINEKPLIVLSSDTSEAQNKHHTGSHTEGTNKMWVYIKNRNLVDILRTVFHELVHIRQSELGMIEPGSSYPGSPIEAMADMLAGKYIKIYGEQNHHIFQ